MSRLMSAPQHNATGDFKQGQLNRLWQGTLSSPDRPSLLHGHGTPALKVSITGQGQVVTE